MFYLKSLFCNLGAFRKRFHFDSKSRITKLDESMVNGVAYICSSGRGICSPSSAVACEVLPLNGLQMFLVKVLCNGYFKLYVRNIVNIYEIYICRYIWVIWHWYGVMFRFLCVTST